MGISQIQPSLILLLASLFFLPALVPGVKFRNCSNISGGDPVTVSSVKISPDSYNLVNRTGTFTLKADTTQYLDPDELTVNLVQFWNLIPYTKEYPLCSVTACPVDEPGPLTLTFTDVFSAAPQTKPVKEDFMIEILLDEEFRLPIMCAYFTLWPKQS